MTITYPTLQSLLSIRLYSEIYHQGDVSTERNVPDGTKLLSVTSGFAFQEVQRSCKRVGDAAGICYSSAIALKLAATKRIPVSEVIAQLTQRLNTGHSNWILENPNSFKSVIQAILPDLLIHITASGHLSAQFSARAIALWLYYVSQDPPTLYANGSKLEQPSLKIQTHWAEAIWIMQYSHARCCSLLHLAQVKRLIPVTHLAGHNTHTSLSLNLQGNSIVDIPEIARLLHLTHSSEQHLIASIVDLLDSVYSCSLGQPARSQDLNAHDLNAMVRAGQRLSNAFQAFHRDCRLWGEVQRTQPDQVLARLQLVAIAQACLRLLLEECLKIPAPLEL